MPRDPQGETQSPNDSIEHRDPRMAARPQDGDVRIDRRDRDLHEDLPSVTNRDAGARDDAPVEPRSDARIAEMLHDTLTGPDSIQATAVLPAVTDGVVTLNGWVQERAMKQEAERIARGVAGVRDVVNRLHIGEPADALGQPGQAIRSGDDQQGSGFSSSARVDIDENSIGDDRDA